MTFRSRIVSVMQLPAKPARQNERAFLREIATATPQQRPAIVLDCSQVHEMDSASMHLLLCCLEETMKRNGDVRLAGVSAHAMENLRAMGIDRLFRIFDSNEKAIDSFRRRAVLVPPDIAVTLASEHAA